MKYILILFLFMLLSGPRLNFPDLNLSFSFFLALLSPFVLFKEQKISNQLYFLFALLLCYFIYSIFNSIINNVIGFASIEQSLRVIIWFLASLSITFLYKKHYGKSRFLLPLSNHILWSLLVNCIFVVLVMFVPLVREFSTVFLSNNERMISLVNTSVRATDLVMGGGSVASVVFSVFFVYSLCLYQFTKSKLAIISILFSILGAIFTGRTGFLLIIASYIPTVCLANYYLKGSFKFFVTLYKFLLTVLVILFILVSFFFIAKIISPEMAKVVFDKSFSWSFEMFINLYETGSLSTDSTTVLMSMYDSVSFSDVFSLFGSSLSGRDRDVYYLHTDVGYLRLLYTSGILGFILVFSKYFYLIISCLKFLFNRELEPFKMAMVISMFYYIFAIFVVNFKEYHEGIRSGFPLLMIFSIVLLSFGNKINGKYE
ncbi:hypothetical protein [Vibrio cyclitrophicus]|uniref:hypothetical protein n=1 Tax=Vibrio cyclitrophicus TaxID=47951 RepID=UPI001C963FDC|nr:hypothetical protein [Vibrio cyclitrophicus]